MSLRLLELSRKIIGAYNDTEIIFVLYRAMDIFIFILCFCCERRYLNKNRNVI